MLKRAIRHSLPVVWGHETVVGVKARTERRSSTSVDTQHKPFARPRKKARSLITMNQLFFCQQKLKYYRRMLNNAKGEWERKLALDGIRVYEAELKEQYDKVVRWG